MQRDPTGFTGDPSFAYGPDADGCIPNGSLGDLCNYRGAASPAFIPVDMKGPKIERPLDAFKLQPSKVCPRNFIIFDHTDDKGRIMYHPALVNKLTPSNMDIFPCLHEVRCRSSGRDSGNLEEQSSSFKEDSEEIDALLSSDEESDEDDVVSTGRTPEPLDSGPFDSSSAPRFNKIRHLFGKSSICHGSMENATHENIRKMVTVLRGIIPGGEQLDTPALLEEAVQYLKFLKVEAKNLGVDGLDK